MSTELSPNEIGDRLEAHTRAVLQGRRVPQSGGGKFVKLDVRDGLNFVISCKATTTLRQTSMRAVARIWREAVRGARGAQGHGDGARPAAVFEVDGEILFMARLDDWADVVTAPAEALLAPSKAQNRRDKSRSSKLE